MRIQCTYGNCTDAGLDGGIWGQQIGRRAQELVQWWFLPVPGGALGQGSTWPTSDSSPALGLLLTDRVRSRAAVFSQRATTHWCATNDPRCHGGCGEGDVLVGPRGDVSPLLAAQGALSTVRKLMARLDNFSTLLVCLERKKDGNRALEQGRCPLTQPFFHPTATETDLGHTFWDSGWQECGPH